MSDMPDKAKLSYRTVDIKRTKRLGDTGSKVFGEYDHSAMIMNIADDIPIEEQANTFLHEYFHLAIATHRPLEGVADEDAVEERVVSVLANAVSELFKMNPEAAKWMVEGMQ